ncbi:MAG TPA: aminoglycoside phosphotransferase family protein [Anaerolineaceae bacterium]|nr:aminoglycoside phosphotransferase family protein [Anaerolineaceae bacterium]HPN53527.1 aminoglycoside phosphotransferase family protein [Anaerolineaceae bacterium]
MQPESIPEKPLAEGRTAEVFVWDDNTILKLYHEWCPADWIEREFQVVQALTTAGIPTPAATGTIKIKGRRGILFEKIQGMSMLADLRAHPLLVFRHAVSLAELQSQFHQLTIPGLNQYHDSLEFIIKRTSGIAGPLREKALSQLRSLPRKDCLCHGDFHPGNVMMSARGPVIIDWMTACSGNPLADVTRTSMILSIGIKGAGKQISPLLRLFSSLFHQVYLDRYFKLTSGKKAEMDLWMPVICAARLDEKIPSEQEALLQIISRQLS